MVERILARITSFLAQRSPQKFEPGERVRLIKALLELEPVPRQEAVDIVNAILPNTHDFHVISCDKETSKKIQTFLKKLHQFN